MELLDKLRNALHLERAARPSLVAVPVNARAYDCTHGSCQRKAYASGLCNAHYLRQRQGVDMDKPFQHRGRNTLCSECDKPVGSKGGWGLCQRHYRSARSTRIKAVLVEHKGGCCQHCGGTFHPAAYDFHHTGPKEGSISSMIANASVVSLAQEVADCILLCANCHRIEHANGNTTLSSLP